VGGNIYHLNKSECVKDKIIVYDNLISDSYYYSVKFSIIFFTAITDLAEAYKDFEFVLKIKSKEVLKQKKISAIYEQLSSQDNVSISVESHGINYLNSSIATISLGLNSAGILAASAGVKSIFFVPNDFYIDSTVGRLTCATQYSDLSSFLDHSLSSHVLDRLTVIDRELCSAPASYIEFVKHMQSEEL